MPASARWTLPNVLAILAMWAVMMAAMMLPSALPMVLTFVNMGRRGGDVARGRSFVAAYLAVWFAFNAAATLARARVAGRSTASRAVHAIRECAKPAVVASPVLTLSFTAGRYRAPARRRESRTAPTWSGGDRPPDRRR